MVHLVMSHHDPGRDSVSVGAGAVAFAKQALQALSTLKDQDFLEVLQVGLPQVPHL
jgi:hypothetical protein